MGGDYPRSRPSALVTPGSTPRKRGIFVRYRFTQCQPRVGGEYSTMDKISAAFVGSPPLERGILCLYDDVPVSLWGSTPLMRGLRPPVLYFKVFDRITPAWAGNTTRAAYHPIVCAIRFLNQFRYVLRHMYCLRKDRCRYLKKILSVDCSRASFQIVRIRM